MVVAALGVTLAGFGWVLFQALLSSPQVAFVAAGIVAALFAAAHVNIKRDNARLHALAHERSGETICAFARDFDRRSIDTWVIRAVYEQLQRQPTFIHPAFPLRADDRLKEDLLLDDDDLDLDIAPAIEARTRRTLDGTFDNPYIGKVRTARDLVLFFQHQPKQSSVT